MADLGLVGVGDSGFTPIRESSLEAWYEARLIDSPPADGGDLSTWEDEGPNGRNMAAGTAATYYSTTSAQLCNGHPTVLFNGTNDYLWEPDFSYSLNTGLWFYTLARRSENTTQYNAYISQVDANQLAWDVYTQGNAAGKYRIMAFASSDGINAQKAVQTAYDFDIATYYLVEVHIKLVINGTEVFVNGIAQSLSGADAAIAAIHNSTSYIRLGSDGFADYFGGNIAAVCWGTGTLGEPRRQQFRNFFNKFYKLL